MHPPTGSSSRPLRIAVLFSGRGSNLAALIDAAGNGRFDVAAAFCDRADAGGMAIAAAAGIPCSLVEPKSFVDKAAFEAALIGAVEASDVDLVVLAGFMRVLTAATVLAWQCRLINIHPSLLPAYPGLHTHARALADGAAWHGASVHFVTPVVDGGPVLMQARVPVLAGDDADSLGARVLAQEHRLLVAAVEMIAMGEVQLVGGRICVNGVDLAAPIQLE